MGEWDRGELGRIKREGKWEGIRGREGGGVEWEGKRYIKENGWGETRWKREDNV